MEKAIFLCWLIRAWKFNNLVLEGMKQKRNTAA